jgi:murein tripeptide amidase MpaA
MWYLLENYGTNDEVTYLVNNHQLYFVPCINPDGYVYNQTTNPNGGGMWRKNRRNNGGGVYGVDLNQNKLFQSCIFNLAQWLRKFFLVQFLNTTNKKHPNNSAFIANPKGSFMKPTLPL